MTRRAAGHLGLLLVSMFGAAGARSAPQAPDAGPPQCKVDADCALDDVDCSECGTCPGWPHPAISRVEREARLRWCEAHPPLWRLPFPPNDGGLPPPAPPNCSPCPNPPDAGRLPTAAACAQGRCVPVVR